MDIDDEILLDREKLIDALENGLDPNSKILFIDEPIITYWAEKADEEIGLLLLDKGADQSPY